MGQSSVASFDESRRTLKTPELPEGYFFRVTKRGTLEGFVKVQLRRSLPISVQDFLWVIGIKSPPTFRVSSRWAIADALNISERMNHMVTALEDRKNKRKHLNDEDYRYVGEYL